MAWECDEAVRKDMNSDSVAALSVTPGSSSRDFSIGTVVAGSFTHRPCSMPLQVRLTPNDHFYLDLARRGRCAIALRIRVEVYQVAF